MSDGFWTNERKAALEQRVDKSLIKQRDGGGGKKLSYIEGHTAIEQLNTIFGVDGWCSEVSPPQFTRIEGTNVLVVTVVCRITAGGVTHEGLGVGVVENVTGRINEFELQAKAAATDSLKRAAIHFGNAMALHLYDKEDEAHNVSRFPSQRTVEGGNTQGRPGSIAAATGAKVACSDCGNTIEGYKSGPTSKYKGQNVTAEQLVIDTTNSKFKRALCIGCYKKAFDAEKAA